MAAKLSDPELAAIEQQLSQHPEILKAITADAQKWSGPLKYVSNDPRFQGGPAEVFKQFGIDFPDAGDYQIQVDPQGRVKLDRQNWFKRNMDWIVPVSVIGGGGAIGLATGGGAPGAAMERVLGSGSEPGGILDKIGDFAKGNWKDILGGAGDAVAGATDAAGKNRYTKDELSMQANRDYENALMGREGAEQKERNTALDNVYRNSWYTNRTAGPNNTRGITPMSQDYMATLGNLASQGNQVLANAPQYGMTSPTIDPLKKFQPTDPSTMEKIGTYAGPILAILGALAGKR